MPGVKIRGYGTIELDEKRTRAIPINQPIKIGELYRDDSLEIEE